ncbi:branched-chain amino acid ABC transporter substrate-binding protein [Roseibium denhamense]|uniref:Amino acid/amide ABC transporter substrate-binding protein, HAAT family n=1 Tax=Roseibium denhamense TaxID=76305 RepID=A0ABY1N5V9_9HYPH|nr:branched-chain amino acid ABC transporter substrate-binding protein [Roseibium denhamense]MTI04371.1 branched-chain amino acid ABC transporter substrate-binding protein [Roseibium denhamense]SMP00822.1 amino acid/amide ABC transporter substrate-binding protein, HAAT family [Roseibium denhamense]
MKLGVSALLAWAMTLCLAGVSRAEIPIAVAGPMKGQFGIFGAQMIAGARQAVQDINSAGGVNGQALTLETADDNCDGDQANAVANQLIGKGVVFVAGHFCFVASVAASRVYANAGIIQISPATTLPGFTDDRPGKGIYRLAPRDDAQAEAAAAFLAENFQASDIAILHDKTAYGKGLTDAVKERLNDLDIIESFALGFDAGEDDYRYLVSQLALEGADVVYLGAYPPEAGLIKLEMARQIPNVVLMGADALVSEEFWSTAGEAANGTVLTYPEFLTEVPEAAALMRSLEDQDAVAERYFLSTYAAVEAWAAAANRAGTTSFEEVVTELEQESVDTVLGPITFNAVGDASRPGFAVYEWQDGALRRRQ